MQQHEQPLAPTAQQAAQPVQPLNTSVEGQGPLSAGASDASYDPVPKSMNPKEAKSLHKTLEKEAKAEDSNIKHQIKDIGKVRDGGGRLAPKDEAA